MEKNRYEKESFTKIVKESNNLTDIVEKLGLKPFCGNRATVKKYIKLYGLDISHFRIDYSKRKQRRGIPLEEIMVENSMYNTTNLKLRLYDEGLKKPNCELCGQNETWRGKKMGLILDHINGINNDHRFENLRIVCPNCNATLSTHGGRNRNSIYIETIKKNNKSRIRRMTNLCKCGEKIYKDSTMCNNCYAMSQRTVERPPYKQLISEINEMGYSATGRKYGVSDNAIRKWVRYYEKYEKKK